MSEWAKDIVAAFGWMLFTLASPLVIGALALWISGRL